MSKQRDEIKLPTWEILAAIVGYFTSVDSVISLIGKTFIGYDEVPRSIKVIISISYFIILILISWITLFHIHRPKLITNENNFDNKNNELKDILKRIIIIEAFKTLGLSLIRGKYLEFFDVNLFDFFQRPNNWIPRDDLFKFIRRFIFSDFTYHYEFSNKFQFIEFKKTLLDSEKFGPSEKHTIITVPKPYLLFSSFKCVLWILAHSLALVWIKIRGK